MKGVLSISFLLCSFLLLLKSSTSLPLCVDSSLSSFSSYAIFFSTFFHLVFIVDVYVLFFFILCRGTFYPQHYTRILPLQWKHVLQLHWRCTNTQAVPTYEHIWSCLCLSFEISTLCGKVLFFAKTIYLKRTQKWKRQKTKCFSLVPPVGIANELHMDGIWHQVIFVSLIAWNISILLGPND